MSTLFRGLTANMYADAQTLLQRHKIRLTFARIATLAMLFNSTRPLSVDAIFGKLSESAQDVSRSSVYRALTEFQKAGLALQGWEDIESGKMVYARAPDTLPSSLYRLVCGACGKVTEIHDKLLAQQFYYHAVQSNFDKRLNDIHIRIICNDCAE